MTRLPSTGIMTSWCASIAPSHWLKIIVFINHYLVRYGVPFLLILPICFTFYLIPALGVCRQRAVPYPFGSVWIHFIDSAFGLTNKYFHLSNLVFCMTIAVVANIFVVYKVRGAMSKIVSPVLSLASKRANTSITITTLAMIIFYVTTGVFLSAFFGLFLSDFLMTRLPSTGVVTAWCASVAPNHWLKIIVFVAVYFNYLVLYFPFLLVFMRLIAIMYPLTHTKINQNVVSYGVPFFLILPICFTFYLFPALGVCRQRSVPYPFGSVWIHFIGSAFDLKNKYFHLSNLVFWMTFSVFANFFLVFKVRQASSKLESPELSLASKKANTSLTITTFAMIIFYFSTGMFLIIFIIYFGTNSYFNYVEIFRPFANDLQFCVVTWVFYATHPAFRNTSVVEPLSSGSWFRRRFNHYL
ncbi:unnamed protein product [Caenorhabditis brenneri]